MGLFWNWFKKAEKKKRELDLKAKQAGKISRPKRPARTARTPGARARRRKARISRASKKFNRRRAKGMSRRGKTRP